MSDEVQAYHDRKLVGMLAPESRDTLLDAGCGPGDQVVLLSPLVKRITAIDFSPAMIDRCRARVAEADVANADVATADVTGLPFEYNVFDKVTCIAVMQYLNPEEVDMAIAELTRVTKPGGLLVIHVKDLWSPTGLIITFGRFLRALIKKRPSLEYQYRTHWWYKTRLKKFGAIEASYAYGTWTPFMPKKLMSLIAAMEIKHRFFQNRWPHGKEYFIQVRVKD